MLSSDNWRNTDNLVASSYSLATVIARYRINKYFVVSNLSMGVDVEVYRRRIGGFNSGWSNMAATWMWKKGCGIKSCSLSLCIAMSLILICGMDIEVNPGATKTMLTAMEQRSTRNPRNQRSSPEEGARHRPTEVILEDILSKLEGFNDRFDKMEKLEAVTEKWKKP